MRRVVAVVVEGAHLGVIDRGVSEPQDVEQIVLVVDVVQQVDDLAAHGVSAGLQCVHLVEHEVAEVLGVLETTSEGLADELDEHDLVLRLNDIGVDIAVETNGRLAAGQIEHEHGSP